MPDYGTPPQDPNQPNPYAQPATGSGQAPSAKKGFLGSLFDFGFEHFITPMIVKVVYILATIGLVLGWFIFLIGAFSQSAGLGIVVLILGPIGVVLYLAFIRMTLEFYLAIVRMSEDIHHRLR